MIGPYNRDREFTTRVSMTARDHSRLSELALSVATPLEDVKWYVRIMPPEFRFDPTDVQITMGAPHRGNYIGAGVLYEVPESFIVNMAGAVGCKIHEELLEKFPVTVIKESLEEATTDD